MAGERRCPVCGSEVVLTRAANGLLRCPVCMTADAPVSAAPRPAPGPAAAGSKSAPGPGKARVLPPLQARPARRRNAGQAAALAMFVLLVAAAATLAVITHPWDAGSILPGADGGSSATGSQGGLVEGRPVAPEPDENGLYNRVYQFEYGGNDWTFTLKIPQTAYDAFHDADRPVRLITKDATLYRQMAYDIFVTTPADDAYIHQLADELQNAATQKGWTADQTLSFALAFVQALPYSEDKVTAAFDEYPRYPLETLVDNGGDCEDTAILYASLVQALGYGAILVSPPNHMAVGVKADDNVEGTSYAYQGSRYLYAETTGSTWALGDAPDQYRGATAQIFDLVAKPLFSLDDPIYGPIVGGMQEIILNATNVGSAPASNIMLAADLTSGVQSYDFKSCSFAAVAPGAQVECSIKLDLRKVPRGQEVEIISKVQDLSFVYASQESEPWIPRP